MYFDLKNNNFIKRDDNKGLSYLYNNVIGRIILKVATSSIVAKIYALYMNSSLSKIKIKKFIKKNNINLDDYEEKKYKSFNDFFIRKIKKDRRVISDGLFAVADSKLSVYKIDNESKFNIKNSIYTVNELLGSETNEFDGGYALVFRLCVDDYHHYVFPDDGDIINNKKIKGTLHTVQPIAFKKYKVFNENTREITYLNCKKYGLVAYIEVGAMMIGKIVNEDVKTFKRGEEKGHFEFGGSTVVLLFKKDKININDILIYNTNKDIETIVKLGQSLE